MELTQLKRGGVTPDRHPLAADIRSVVLEASHRAPRSQQQALGPSEIGEVCPRKLAYKLMRHTESNTDSDPWASIVGTAVHAWLADAFLAANARLGRIRYLVEQRLVIRGALTGTCDLYDADRQMVIDHKVPGVTSMNAAKKNGPSPTYIAQAHLYGYGYVQLGLPVKDVALALYPRAGMLSGLWVWTQPYDESVALQALARHDSILEVAAALDVAHHAERYRDVPRVTGHACTYCPYWKPGTDTGDGCPGHMERDA
jgi:hypothetical protein